MGCVRCGERLYFSERVAWPSEFCRRCALYAGITRLADHGWIRNVATEASRREPWWRWTVWLFWALGFDRKELFDRWWDDRDKQRRN